jgi:Ca2+-binding RTX toxin-like protein
VIADLLTPANNFGDAAGDTYISIEGLVGTAFNDTLRGDNGGNFLEGGLGADLLDGRDGGDSVTYQNATTGITANLANSALNTGEAAGDIYISIENLRGGAFGDVLVGNNGNNFLRGGEGADVLDGGNGNDTADYFNSTVGLIVDLATPGNNTGEAVGDSYVAIENIRAGNGTFDDQLYGDANSNNLEGMAGIDVLDGRGGVDFASYQSSTSAVVANLGNTAVNAGDAAGDTYTSIEGLIGTNLNDTLVGDGGNNFLRGGLGADSLDGGAGGDYADYIGSSAGLTVNLGNAVLNTGEAVGDTFANIEHIRGSNSNDSLTGDAGNNFLRGGSGADTLDGGGGIDTADYFSAATGVTVSLTNPGSNTGEATGDTFTAIENLRGGASGDTLTGDTAANAIDGQGGNDRIDGASGNDVLTGGANQDTFVFNTSGFGQDTITDFTAGNGTGHDLIELSNSSFADFEEILTATTDVGGNAVITVGADSITLTGVLEANLNISNFQLV